MTVGTNETPDDLTMALEERGEARAAYDRLPPRHRHEYLEWIDDAKRPGTRRRRIAKTVEMLLDV